MRWALLATNNTEESGGTPQPSPYNPSHVDLPLIMFPGTHGADTERGAIDAGQCKGPEAASYSACLKNSEDIFP